MKLFSAFYSAKYYPCQPICFHYIVMKFVPQDSGWSFNLYNDQRVPGYSEHAAFLQLRSLAKSELSVCQVYSDLDCNSLSQQDVFGVTQEEMSLFHCFTIHSLLWSSLICKANFWFDQKLKKGTFIFV